jgi:hypothetical protein
LSFWSKWFSDGKGLSNSKELKTSWLIRLHGILHNAKFFSSGYEKHKPRPMSNGDWKLERMCSENKLYCWSFGNSGGHVNATGNLDVPFGPEPFNWVLSFDL